MQGENVIREYRDDDLNDLLDSWSAASEAAHPFLSEAFLAQERKNIADVYLPNTETWVAETEGRVVGFVALMGNEIGAIFVHPAQHGTGTGRALMEKAQELRGELFVEVFTDNAIGRAFYAKCGFEPIGAKVHEATGFELQRLHRPGGPDGDAAD